jgi:hypothetical protein
VARKPGDNGIPCARHIDQLCGDLSFPLPERNLGRHRLSILGFISTAIRAAYHTKYILWNNAVGSHTCAYTQADHRPSSLEPPARSASRNFKPLRTCCVRNSPRFSLSRLWLGTGLADPNLCYQLDDRLLPDAILFIEYRTSSLGINDLGDFAIGQGAKAGPQNDRAL